jgi:4-amino-4-deoxy-L-arabinose transferase-like glycosyltransferase
LLIAHGRIHPLTNVDPYIGALWNYLLAGLFLITGPSLYSPRAVVALLGALTVVPAYLLGRSLGGRWVGAITAVLLALSPAHVVVNSHIGWSNCITPLFTTVGLWLTQRAVAADSARGLAWAGIAWGLALQTHPTAALLLPAAGLYVVLARPRWVRSRWTWAAVGLALMACSTLLVANLESNFAGLRAGERVEAQYAGGESLTLEAYGRRLGATVSLLSDGLGGAITESERLRGPLGSPLDLVFDVLVLVGLGLAAQRGRWLPLIAVGTYVALLPVVNARFEPLVPKARYVAPLLPLCYVAIGLLAAELHRRAGGLAASTAAWGAVWAAVWAAAYLPTVARAGIVVGVAALLLLPQTGLVAYYREAIASGRTNVAFYETVAAVNAARRRGETVYFDRTLQASYAAGGGQLLEQLQLAGNIYGWSRQTIDLPPVTDDPSPSLTGLLVVPDRDVPIAVATLRLQGVSGSLPGGTSVYRVFGSREKASSST